MTRLSGTLLITNSGRANFVPHEAECARHKSDLPWSELADPVVMARFRETFALKLWCDANEMQVYIVESDDADEIYSWFNKHQIWRHADDQTAEVA